MQDVETQNLMYHDFFADVFIDWLSSQLNLFLCCKEIQCVKKFKGNVKVFVLFSLS